MAELNLAPPPERSPAKAIGIAVAVLAVIAAVVFLLNPHKIAELSISDEKLFGPHTEMTGLAGQSGTHVIGTGPSTEDDLYVTAMLHVDNKLRLPIFVSSVDATMTAADGSTVDATVISPRDFSRLGETYPQLAAGITNPLLNDAEAAPKGTVAGDVLLLFPGVDETAWKAKKSATLTVNLTHQGPMTVALP